MAKKDESQQTAIKGWYHVGYLVGRESVDSCGNVRYALPMALRRRLSSVRGMLDAYDYDSGFRSGIAEFLERLQS